MGVGDPCLAEGVPEDVGASGEYFVYQYLHGLLPDFVRACWISSLKLHYFPDATWPIENDLGADFCYVDRGGRLSGSGRSETVYIEVKSMTQESMTPFRLSINEWNRAMACHESGGKEVYVLAVVLAVTRAPTLAALVVDPVAQVEQGAATCTVSELVYSQDVLTVQHEPMVANAKSTATPTSVSGSKPKRRTPHAA